MDIHNVIVTAAEEVIHAVEEAKKALAGQAVVDFPSRVEIEFGITSSYEVANYDDVRVATVRVSVPLFKANGKEGKESVTELAAPASAAVAEDKKNGHGHGNGNSKKENGKKTGPSQKKKP